MPLLIATLVTLFLGAASLVVLGAVGGLHEPAAAAAGTPETAAKVKCPACGFVQSVRRIKAHGSTPETYEITLRLRDGSTHVLTEAAPANWRRGERVVFIAGERQPGR